MWVWEGPRLLLPPATGPWVTALVPHDVFLSRIQILKKVLQQ